MVKVAIVEGLHQKIEGKDGAPALVAVKNPFYRARPTKLQRRKGSRRMSVRKVRPCKALSIGFFSLLLLAGCGGNEPSSSDIKQQISAQFSPCSELSISDFQKINGYPQTDGSYIEQVQYTITFTPSNAMLDLVSDADKMSQNLINGDSRSAVATDDDNAQLNRDLSSLISGLKQDCPISVPGGALGVFNVDSDNPDSYGKTLSAQFSGNVHLVKSDNGWALQN